MTARVDLAVIGLGLSGARSLVELIDALAAHNPRPGRPLSVALIDPAGEPGRGVPYGRRSDRRALLIETLAETRCPEFSQWLGQHLHLLTEMQHSPDADDRAWHLRNAAALTAGELANLYLPRHLFGTFSARTLEQALDRGRRHGMLTASIHRAEVREVQPLPSGAYAIRCDDGTSMECGSVLVAVGSIPRADEFGQSLAAAMRHRYITDSAFCGSFGLRDSLDLYGRREPTGPVRLAIIGAAASAIESLYCAVNHPPLSQRIESITTISRSGMLPGGISGNRQVVASNYALARTSADVYVRTARHWLERGCLNIMPARVDAIETLPGSLCVETVDTLDGRRSRLEFDLVINCSGAGLVHTSPSRLLAFLGQRLEVRREGRGFRTNPDHSLTQWPRVFLAGPLLNRGEAATDVESISAVFRVARELGQSLATTLLDVRNGAGAPAVMAN